MKSKLYLLLVFFASVYNVVAAQQVISLFENPVLTKDAPGELMAQRARTAVIDFDLRDLSSTSTLKLDLFEDLSYTVRMDRQDRNHPAGDADVYWGNSGDPAWAHVPHYHDVILTVNRANGKAMLYAMTSDGMFVVTPTTKEGQYLIYEAEDTDWASQPCSDVTKTSVPESTNKSLMTSGCEEQDADGKYVVDMFFSYSIEAELFIGDVVAHSISQAETVNIGLANSEVNNTYLRVVDIAVGDNFVGIVSNALSPNLDFYRDQMEAVGADMISDYQTAKPGVSNAGGWAFVPGRTSINGIGAPGAFRHEWGHNSGSNHCTPGVLPYSSGFDNGNGNNKTHLCGNNINFFSNPRLNDVNGVPIGDVASADNARAILEERGRVMSGYRTHLVPYDGGDTGNCPAALTDGAYHIQNVASGNYLTPGNVGNVGEMIFQGATNTDNEDIWEVHNLGDGRVSIYNRNRNTTLDRFGSSNAVGNNVGVWSHNNLQSNQTWAISEAVSGNYLINSTTSGNVLRVPDGMFAAGDEVWQDVNDGSLNTEWRFLPVTVSPPVVSIVTAENATDCSSAVNGTLTAQPSGGVSPYAYEWEDGSSAAGLTNVAPGTYTVTVTSGGRRYFRLGTIRTVAPLIAEVTTTRATPSAGGDISITNVINATAPLNYAWSDGGPNAADRTNVPAGDYTVTITDGNGCEEVRKLRVVKTIAAGDYVIQHVPSGLYLEREGGQVLLGDCPTDADQYRWTAVDNGGAIVKFRNNNGLMLTVFGRTDSGAEYWTGGDGDVSPHKHSLIPTGTDTWIMQNQFQGFYTGAKTDAVGGILIHEDLAEPATADEFRFIPIVSCTPTPGAICSDEDGDNAPDDLNLICECCGLTMLPVTLTRFYGEALAKANQLHWTTASESQNAGFFVERSFDGQRYTEIAWVAGSGDSARERTYAYDDETPLGGTSFYRLRQVDFDGAETLSNVVALARAEGANWSFFPNPVSGKDNLWIRFRGEAVDFSLFRLNGQLVRSLVKPTANGEVVLVTTGLPQGVYLLRNNGDGTVKRVVVQ